MAARTTKAESTTTTSRIAELEALLAAEQAKLETERAKLETERAKLAALTIEHKLLKLAYEDLRIKVALDQHRLVVAKAERLDTTQLEIELGAKVAELDELNRQLGLLAAPLNAPADPAGDAIRSTWLSSTNRLISSIGRPTRTNGVTATPSFASRLAGSLRSSPRRSPGC